MTFYDCPSNQVANFAKQKMLKAGHFWRHFRGTALRSLKFGTPFCKKYPFGESMLISWYLTNNLAKQNLGTGIILEGLQSFWRDCGSNQFRSPYSNVRNTSTYVVFLCHLYRAHLMSQFHLNLFFCPLKKDFPILNLSTRVSWYGCCKKLETPKFKGILSKTSSLPTAFQATLPLLIYLTPKKKTENCRKMWRISYKNSSNQWWSNVASEAKRKRRWPAKVVITMVGTAFSVSHGEK